MDLNILKCEDYRSLPEVVGNSALWSGFPATSGKSVFIKPNLVVPPIPNERQSVTHLAVVEETIKKLLNDGAREIVLGCCGFKGAWQDTLELWGANRLTKYGVKVVCLHSGEYEWVKAKDYWSLAGTKVSKFLLEADVVLNLPKLKVHWRAGVTGAIKNMVGCISPKGSMHPGDRADILHKRLRDLYFLMRPLVDWVLMDGIEGAGYAEHGGIVEKSGVLIAGRDMFEVDCWAADVIGIDRDVVGYLRYIGDSLGGWPERLEEKWRKGFELPLSWRVGA